MRVRSLPSGLAFFAICGLASLANAQCLVTEQAKLIPTNGANADAFGFSVSVEGDVALVGAIGQDSQASNGGAVYVFRNDGTEWAQDQRLTENSFGDNQNFGTSVSVSGTFAWVGAPGSPFSGTDGEVFIYEDDGSFDDVGSFVSASEVFDNFGAAVDVNGSVAAVGAPGYSTITPRGNVTLYRHDGTDWLEEQTVSLNGPLGLQRFGNAVAVSGDVLAVGAPGSNPVGQEGVVAIYRFDGSAWVEEQVLEASDGNENERFGSALDLDGDTLVVGAPLVDNGTGAAYVFRFDGSGWVEEQKLSASDATPQAQFGGSVSVSGTRLVVGSGLPFGDGAGYVFSDDGSSWVEQEKLTSGDGDLAGFGNSVAINGDRILVGGPGSLLGSANVFDMSEILLDVTVAPNQDGDDVLTVTTCGGAPESPLLVAVVGSDGLPLFVRFDFNRFDEFGGSAYQGIVPPILRGVTWEFQSFGISLFQRARASNRMSVDFPN